MQHRLPLRRRARCAFTLLELSVSIGIIGILLGSSLVVVSQKTGQTQLEVSEEHLDDIVTALTRFEIRKGYLPCPASLTELPTAAEFGRPVNAGDCTYTVAPDGTTRVETSAGSGDWVLTGAVPIYDLNFPDEFMADTFGNRYSYSVMQSLTKASTFEDGAGAIVLKDGAGNDVITDGAYVVLSHGSDGKGAYRFESGALKSACGASANLDVENCNADAAFRKAPFNDGQEAATYFDDLVRWRSKQHFAEPIEVAEDPCDLPWGGQINHGESVTAYEADSGTPSCNSETRSCTNGTLSNSFTYESCTELPDYTAFVLNGIDTNDVSGRSVASGDINGDGYDDVIVGAEYADPNGQSDSGETYVVFGQPNGWEASLNLSSLDGSNGFILNGIDAGDWSGHSVSSGDINGDGFDDVIIGANRADPNGQSDAGETYVVFGKASGWAASTNLSTLDGTTGFVLNGIDAGDASGESVSSGDINGDSFDDVIIGAYSATPAAGRTRAGETYVVFGKASGWAASTNLSSLNGTTGFRLDGATAQDESGWNVSSGNVNGDGFDDVIIGAYRGDPNGQSNAGESYVVFGKASGWAASTNLSSLNGTTGFVLNGIDAYDESGKSVSSGDINGDGFDDVITAGYTAFSNTGAVYVVFGKAGAWTATMSLSTLDGTNGFRLDGTGANLNSFGMILGTGNVIGDGYQDIFLSDVKADSNRGHTYVVFGKASGWAATMNVSTLNGTNGFRMDGLWGNDRSGYSLSGGDVNGDGYDDLIVGSHYNGRVCVVFGKASGWGATNLIGSFTDGTQGFRMDIMM